MSYAQHGEQTIVLLGASGSGKTTLLAGMKLSPGITTQGTDVYCLDFPDKATSSYLEEKVEQMCSLEGSNRRIIPTQGNALQIKVQVQKNTLPVVDLRFLDYTGESIGRNDDVDQAIVTDLKTTVGVVLLLPTPFLLKPIQASNIGMTQRKAGLRRIHDSLEAARHELRARGQRVPLVVALTQFDKNVEELDPKTGNEIHRRPLAEIFEDVKKLLPTLFGPHQDVFQVFVCPVNIGWDLDDTWEKGSVDPTGVTEPIAFITRCFLRRKLQEANQAVANAEYDRRMAALRAEEKNNKFLTKVARAIDPALHSWVMADVRDSESRAIDHSKSKVANLGVVTQQIRPLASALNRGKVFWKGNVYEMTDNAWWDVE